jgi:uroporphyrinogen decarboxylase
MDNFDQRYTVGDTQGAVEELKKRDFPMALYGSPIGFFGVLRQLIGEPNIYYWFYDHPDILRDIAEHLCTLWLAAAEELTALIDFDCCYFWEDMAYRGGSLVGPDVFREFMAPYYRRLIGFAESRGTRHHYVDTDGYVEDLLPLFVDVGMTGLQPFEVQAGNDVERVRAKYPKLEIFGGVDKMALQSREGIDAELEKVNRMMKTGGFIPYIDHCVPPDVSYENFSYYRRRLNEIIGG